MSNTKYYLGSGNISIFPSAYRGNDGTNAYNPESRLLSEKNVTCLNNSLSDTQGFVEKYDNDTTNGYIDFNIHGYRFVIDLTSFKSLSSSNQLTGNIYAVLALKPKNTDASAVSYDGLCLLNQYDVNSGILDDSALFHGLSFVTEANLNDVLAGLSSYDCYYFLICNFSSAGNTPTIPDTSWLKFSTNNIYNPNNTGVKLSDAFESDGITIKNTTKLKTSRSIWGKSFNGTSPISGDITGTGNITPTTTQASNIGTSDLKYNNIYATTFNGDLTGNADMAKKFDSSKTIELTGDIIGNVSSTGESGWSIVTSIGSAVVGSTELAADSVITSKIKDANVTADKIGTSAVTTDKIESGAVTNAKLAGNITNDKLAGSIENGKLVNSKVTIGATDVSLGATVTTFTGLDSATSTNILTNTITSKDNTDLHINAYLNTSTQLYKDIYINASNIWLDDGNTTSGGTLQAGKVNSYGDDLRINGSAGLYLTGDGHAISLMDSGILLGSTASTPTTIKGITTITNTTISSSTTTGALVVSGGAGVAGDVYFGGQVNANDLRSNWLLGTDATKSTSGDVAAEVYFPAGSGDLYLNSETDTDRNYIGDIVCNCFYLKKDSSYVLTTTTANGLYQKFVHILFSGGSMSNITTGSIFFSYFSNTTTLPDSDKAALAADIYGFNGISTLPLTGGVGYGSTYFPTAFIKVTDSDANDLTIGWYNGSLTTFNLTATTISITVTKTCIASC